MLLRNLTENFRRRRPLPLMSFHTRRLPHWQPEGKSLFITWHLYGSLPHNRYPPPKSLSAGQAFVWMDRYLDQARNGPGWLAREDIALIMLNALTSGAEKLGHYDLHAYVIMANHVHVLVTPQINPSPMLHSLKGFSARQANKLLGLTGQPFWQSESYDHWVRNPQEFDKIRRYIENNPVSPRLVARPEDYRWPSGPARSPEGR